MESHRKLLLQNRVWVQEQLLFDKEFFSRRTDTQTPEFLWIGCSDSRVPANHVTGTTPGDVFVHRNIANLVHSDDTNLVSVLQYSVQVLKVKHIILCGHQNCGGVIAAYKGNVTGTIAHWLEPLRLMIEERRSELEAMPDQQRYDTLVRWNVAAQVRSLSEISVIRDTWKNGQPLAIHGWVYNLNTGLLEEVTDIAFSVETVPTNGLGPEKILQREKKIQGI